MGVGEIIEDLEKQRKYLISNQFGENNLEWIERQMDFHIQKIQELRKARTAVTDRINALQETIEILKKHMEESKCVFWVSLS